MNTGLYKNINSILKEGTVQAIRDITLISHKLTRTNLCEFVQAFQIFTNSQMGSRDSEFLRRICDSEFIKRIRENELVKLNSQN